MRKTLTTLVKIAINHRGKREELKRQLFFRIAQRYTPMVAVDSGDLRLHLSTSEWVSEVMFGSRGFDEDAMRKIIDVLAEQTGRPEPLKDRVVFDIGGNIGTTSMYAVKQYGARAVYAFEPAPDNLRTLRLNLLDNGLADTVEVVAVALSDSDGEVEFEISPENTGDNRVRTAKAASTPGLIGEENRPVVSVPSRRLDTLVGEGVVKLDDVALLWMDVQGHEGHVLAGAPETLARGIPVVLEYWPYGLERAGGLETLHELIATHFTRILDLGPPWSDDPPRELPAADVATLATRYAKADVFADLMLLA